MTISKMASFSLALVTLLICVSAGFSQINVEVSRVKQEEAAASFKKGDLEAALRLYSEAIEVFPKSDDFTPLPRVPAPEEGNLAPREFRGLDMLYLSRFRVHLARNDDDLAQADLNRSLIVLSKEKKREVAEAQLGRSRIDLERERKIENPNFFNSELIKAGFMFNIIGQSCNRIRSTYTYNPKDDYRRSIPERFLKDRAVVDLLSDLDKTCESARFGEAEVYATSAIELRNRERSFQALKLANELVQRYPRNADAFRLRAKVNRFMLNDQQAVRDEQKAEELSLPN